jgi:hypothetical protein
MVNPIISNTNEVVKETKEIKKEEVKVVKKEEVSVIQEESSIQKPWTLIKLGKSKESKEVDDILSNKFTEIELERISSEELLKLLPKITAPELTDIVGQTYYSGDVSGVVNRLADDFDISHQ